MLVDAKIRASDKDLPVLYYFIYNTNGMKKQRIEKYATQNKGCDVQYCNILSTICLGKKISKENWST